MIFIEIFEHITDANYPGDTPFQRAMLVSWFEDELFWLGKGVMGFLSPSKQNVKTID
jgi:hypothetical protein